MTKKRPKTTDALMRYLREEKGISMCIVKLYGRIIVVKLWLYENLFEVNKTYRFFLHFCNGYGILLM